MLVVMSYNISKGCEGEVLLGGHQQWLRFKRGLFQSIETDVFFHASTSSRERCGLTAARICSKSQKSTVSKAAMQPLECWHLVFLAKQDMN